MRTVENSERVQSASARVRQIAVKLTDPTKAGYFWLSAFFVVYCARPEDWIPGLKIIPLAKITAICAMISLLTSLGRTKRTFKDVPPEGKYLLVMILLLFVSAIFSPVWKGGALSQTIDFSKVFIIFVLTFLLITNFERLRKIIFIQTVSVVVISIISIVKGRHLDRLEGVIGGIYSNPNDLAFAVVLTIPFALAFLITSKSIFRKIIWFAGILLMLAALFMTASRGGFVNLVVSGTVTMWHFGVRGKRRMLIAGTALCCIVLMAAAGGKLYDRFAALSGHSATDESAYGSYEARMYLMERAFTGIEHYPVFGIGVNNFMTYSGIWHEVHMTFLQIWVEGGFPCFILFMLFFARGFKNLKILLRTPNLDERTVLFVGALHSSLVGFVVGACFAPEAYQFFPYFAIAFTATMLQTVKEREQESAGEPVQALPKSWYRLDTYAKYRRTNAAPDLR